MSLSRLVLVGTIVTLAMIVTPGARAAAPDAVSAAAHVDHLLKKEVSGAAKSAIRGGRVDDATFLRRLTLDFVGHNPMAEEAVLFALDSDSGKRVKEVDRLLADKRFGENWGRYWRDVIFYRRTEDRALLGAESCTNYLADEFNKNTPWDKIATAIITATGDVTENGATGLILAQAGQPEETAAEVSRIFLGIQIQCAQCHDHPTDRWKREQFHQLTAFFPRIAVQRDFMAQPPVFRVAANDRQMFRMPPNGMDRRIGTPEHYMPDKDNPSARGTLVQPVFFATGQSLKIGANDADRRGTLAEWIATKDNTWFAKAFVNRIWAELVGEGFFEPIDDLGPDRQCSAPETMNYLATSFYDSGYDVKWLYRTIAATEAYQQASRTRRNPDEVPFQHNVNQRLRADALYTNIQNVLGISDGQLGFGRPQGGPRGQFRTPRFQFAQTFGYDPSTHRDEVVGSIPQALLMMNWPTIAQGINARRGNLAKMLAEIKSDEDLSVELYLRTLSREPTAKEIQICQSYVQEVGDRGEAFEDIQWSLLNSAEFLHRR